MIHVLVASMKFLAERAPLRSQIRYVHSTMIRFSALDVQKKQHNETTAYFVFQERKKMFDPLSNRLKKNLLLLSGSFKKPYI